MASRPDHQSLPGITALAGFDPIIFAFIDDLRVREGIAVRSLTGSAPVSDRMLPGTSRHDDPAQPEIVR